MFGNNFFTPKFRVDPREMGGVFDQPKNMSQFAGGQQPESSAQMADPNQYYRQRIDGRQGWQENPYARFSQLAGGAGRFPVKMNNHNWFGVNQQENAIKNIPLPMQTPAQMQPPPQSQTVSTQVMPRNEFNRDGISYNRGWY